MSMMLSFGFVHTHPGCVGMQFETVESLVFTIDKVVLSYFVLQTQKLLSLCCDTQRILYHVICVNDQKLTQRKIFEPHPEIHHISGMSDNNQIWFQPSIFVQKVALCWQFLQPFVYIHCVV